MKKTAGPALIFLSFICLVYQACENPHYKFLNQDASSAQESSQATPEEPNGLVSGNGNPYDGKIWVNINRQRCQELGKAGEVVFSKIEKISANFTLTRDNCAPITPRTLSSSEVKIVDSDPSLLVYNNRPFEMVSGADCCTPVGSGQNLQFSLPTTIKYGGLLERSCHE
jgi:hypothetical protein